MADTVSKKPTVAFVLVLLGGILVLLVGLLTLLGGAVLASFAGMFAGPLGGFVGTLGALFGFIGLISGLVMIVSAVMLHSTTRSRIFLWSVIALVFSCISLIDLFGGFGVGFLLGIIGSILGLVHRR